MRRSQETISRLCGQPVARSAQAAEFGAGGLPTSLPVDNGRRHIFPPIGQLHTVTLRPRFFLVFARGRGADAGLGMWNQPSRWRSCAPWSIDQPFGRVDTCSNSVTNLGKRNSLSLAYLFSRPLVCLLVILRRGADDVMRLRWIRPASPFVCLADGKQTETGRLEQITSCPVAYVQEQAERQWSAQQTLWPWPGLRRGRGGVVDGRGQR